MKHYGIAEWADFIRGMVNKEERVSMSTHLKHGCPRCQRAVDTFGNLFALATSDEGNLIPRSVDRRAKATYVAQQRKHTRWIHRSFFCKTKKVVVDVDFRLNDLWRDFRDVEHCSYFGKGPITCQKGCLTSLNLKF